MDKRKISKEKTVKAVNKFITTIKNSLSLANQFVFDVLMEEYYKTENLAYQERAMKILLAKNEIKKVRNMLNKELDNIENELDKAFTIIGLPDSEAKNEYFYNFLANVDKFNEGIQIIKEENQN